MKKSQTTWAKGRPAIVRGGLVAAAVDAVVHDLAAIAAAAPAETGRRGSVEEDGGVAGAAVAGRPSGQPGGHRRHGQRPLDGRGPAAVGTTTSSVPWMASTGTGRDGRHPPRLGVQRARDDGHRRHPAGQVAGHAGDDPAAGGEAGRGHPGRVDAQAGLEVVEQVGREAQVVGAAPQVSRPARTHGRALSAAGAVDAAGRVAGRPPGPGRRWRRQGPAEGRGRGRRRPVPVLEAPLPAPGPVEPVGELRPLPHHSPPPANGADQAAPLIEPMAVASRQPPGRGPPSRTLA